MLCTVALKSSLSANTNKGHIRRLRPTFKPTAPLGSCACMFKRIDFRKCDKNKNNNFYFILRSEIKAYQKQIKVISITSEMIWY